MNYVDDGTFDWSMGQDAWHNPDRIQPNQYAMGVNLSTRGGVLQPRTGFIEQLLTFEDEFIETDIGLRTSEDVFTTGKFQALIHYRQGGDYLIWVINGRLFITNVETKNTRLLSTTLHVDGYKSRVNWTYAADKVVIFDYPDYPLIIDNLEVRRSNINNLVAGEPAPEVPISAIGAYNQNRLFVGSADTHFTAGDPVGVVQGPITFTEIFLPSSPYVNQQFMMPDGDSIYPITAMGFLQVVDNSTGLGPLFIATERKIYSFNAGQPRESWIQSQFGKVMLANTGIIGPRAYTNVNSDLIFMSSEGNVHTLSSAGNDMRKWGNIPISREVHTWLNPKPGLTKFTVMGYCHNRIFISVNPFRTQALDLNRRAITDYAFGGFVVMELETMASLLAQGSPTWTGLWTGVHPTEIQTVGDRCFVASKEGGNKLYEIVEDVSFDMVGGKKRLVRSRVYTRRYDFQQPVVDKRDSTLLLHMRDIKGELDLQIDKRPAHAMRWLKYGEWLYKAKTGSCEIPVGEFIEGYEPHQIKELIFGNSVEEDCSPVNQDVYERYHSIQFRMTITGEHWVLEIFKVRAMLQQEQEFQNIWLCDEREGLAVPAECNDDWWVPS